MFVKGLNEYVTKPSVTYVLMELIYESTQTLPRGKLMFAIIKSPASSSSFLQLVSWYIASKF